MHDVFTTNVTPAGYLGSLPWPQPPCHPLALQHDTPTPLPWRLPLIHPSCLSSAETRPGKGELGTRGGLLCVSLPPRKSNRTSPASRSTQKLDPWGVQSHKPRCGGFSLLMRIEIYQRTRPIGTTPAHTLGSNRWSGHVAPSCPSGIEHENLTSTTPTLAIINNCDGSGFRVGMPRKRHRKPPWVPRWKDC